MAKSTGLLTVKIRFVWWVKPYLWLARLAILPFETFMDEDCVETYCGRHAGFVARHGIRVSL